MIIPLCLLALVVAQITSYNEYVGAIKDYLRVNKIKDMPYNQTGYWLDGNNCKGSTVSLHYFIAQFPLSTGFVIDHTAYYYSWDFTLINTVEIPPEEDTSEYATDSFEEALESLRETREEESDQDWQEIFELAIELYELNGPGKDEL